MKTFIRNLLAILVILGVMLVATSTVLAESQTGTTLTATKTATAHWQRVWHWSIDKAVTPESWDLFRGDSGTSEYTITVTKTGYTDTIYVAGEICVTNGGAYATENLTIVDEIQYKVGDGQYETLFTQNVQVGGELDPGESHCYSYNIPFTPVAGASYKNVAHVTITNHAGWVPGGHNCPGPEVCPFGPDPKVDFSVPASPDVVVNGSVDVTDTNDVGPWQFSDSGSVSYSKTFTCDGDEGNHDNTATIVQTGQSASASVQVNCYALAVTKDASTFFDRTYHWSVAKSVDHSSLTLALHESFLVNYAVVADVTGYTDSNWGVEGNVYVDNPTLLDATINDVTDIITGLGSVTLDCGVTFPYVLAAGDMLHCTYTLDLPDAEFRTNVATAVLQNYAYDKDKVGTPSGTTGFSGQAAVDFDGAAMTEYDKCAEVIDSYAGYLGTVCYPDVPRTFTYSRTVGDYDVCGSYTVDNTATLTPVDTLAPVSASATVNINIPCGGCSLTIGYWKTHAGFGPQPDMVSALLPQLIGLTGQPKSILVGFPSTAVQLLEFRGSNNVFAASNGINKLYAQLLAAKLNIANGADGSAVASTIISADAFLANKNSLDWAGLSKAQQKSVLNWMTILDNFNNGLIGPGHCDQ